MMLSAIQEAGWPIFPILGFGASTVVLSIRYALAPRRGRLSAIVGLSVLTLLLGVLGTSLGLMKAIEGVANNPDSRWLVMVGLKEALNNLVIALLLIAASTVLASAGASRSGAAAGG